MKIVKIIEIVESVVAIVKIRYCEILILVKYMDRLF